MGKLIDSSYLPYSAGAKRPVQADAEQPGRSVAEQQQQRQHRRSAESDERAHHARRETGRLIIDLLIYRFFIINNPSIIGRDSALHHVHIGSTANYGRQLPKPDEKPEQHDDSERK